MKAAWVPMKCGQSAQAMMAHFVLAEADNRWDLTSVASIPAAQAAANAAPPMAGQFGISGQYTGCTGCGANSYVRCGACGNLGCWNSSRPQFRCGWCGHSGAVSGSIDSLRPADWG